MMQDYQEAKEYLRYRQRALEGSRKGEPFTQEPDANMEYREELRLKKLKTMFKGSSERERARREEICLSIFENLAISDMSDGVSRLRRLEIRFLPLSPLLVI